MSNRSCLSIVLAAGEGTRMKSALPKVLHPIAGVPLIGHVLATAQALEPAHIVAVVRHERERVAAAITELAPEAHIVDQDEIPGTGRAAEVALDAYRETLHASERAELLDERLLPPLRVAQELHELVYAERHLPRWAYAPLGTLTAMFPVDDTHQADRPSP